MCKKGEKKKNKTQKKDSQCVKHGGMWYITAGVDRSLDWSNENHLHISAHIAEHILLDPRSTGDHCSVDIHGHDIRQVNTYKYSGVHIVTELSWHTSVCAKIHRCSLFLRRLRLVFARKEHIFYRTTLESLSCYDEMLRWQGRFARQSDPSGLSMEGVTRLLFGSTVVISVS